MTTEGFKRRLSAVLSADVKEYSRLMRDDEDETIRTLTTYRSSIAKLVQQYRGRVVDSPGDNVLAEFGSVVDAVNCAVEIQRDLAERNAELPYHRRMEFRIGINSGDVIEEGERIYGDGVNIAARVEGLCEGGGICISGTVHDSIEGKLGLEYEYLGEHEVKNIDKPIRVYRVLSFPGAAAHRMVKAKGALERKWRRSAWVIAALVVVVAGALASWNFLLRPTGPTIEPASIERMAFPLPDKPSIAVLPFANMTGDPELEYLCDGISDQIITSLSIIPRLFVIARNSTFTYKGKAVKVQQVAEELGVNYVLEGSIQKSGDKLRVMAQLIDAIKGHHVWSERYDKDFKDVFALQDEIAKKIMTALQVKLTEGEYAAGISRGTSNPRANECFWRGTQHFRRFTKEDNASARQWIEKAIEADPEFSGAWALLGYTHYGAARFGWSESRVESMKQALECAKKALSIHDSNALAWILLGDIHHLKSDFDEALTCALKAVALNPNDPTMLERVADIMTRVGRHEEARSQLKKAMRLSPYYPAYFLFSYIRANLLSNRYEEALAGAKTLQDRCGKGEMSCFWAHQWLAIVYSELGREKEARAHVTELLTINPNYTLAVFRKFAAPGKVQKDVERLVSALRKAGLK